MGFSPGSGAVFNKASRNSARSACPLSSSSKAENADRSSEEGDSWERSPASELRKVGRVTACDVEGGKNAVISELFAESPTRFY